MKATLTCLLLSLISLTFSAAQNPPAAEKNLFARLSPPATHATKENPVADVDERSIAILMADGSEEVVLSIMHANSYEIRVMTNEGVTSIPFKNLHAAAQTYLQPRIAKTAENEEAAAAEADAYRAYRALQNKIDAEKQAAVAKIEAQQQAAAAEAQARQQADYLQRLQIVEAEARANAAYLASEQAARDALAAKQAADPRAIATAKRIEQARIAYQQQLQAHELQIFNALVEVQQLELLRRLGYLK